MITDSWPASVFIVLHKYPTSIAWLHKPNFWADIYIAPLLDSWKPDAGVELFLKVLQSCSHQSLLILPQMWGEFKTGGGKTTSNNLCKFRVLHSCFCKVLLHSIFQKLSCYSERMFLLKRKSLRFETVKRYWCGSQKICYLTVLRGQRCLVAMMAFPDGSLAET